ncbi:hypothetical protein GCK32_010903 [Trichostrongylus colubriformis]|uniref:ShKT domain-containing protein n=1 Tax=Trichostrongylus colubriformis TaxID=6319 RepID=A0AAN8F714_TRICO
MCKRFRLFLIYGRGPADVNQFHWTLVAFKLAQLFMSLCMPLAFSMNRADKIAMSSLRSFGEMYRMEPMTNSKTNSRVNTAHQHLQSTVEFRQLPSRLPKNSRPISQTDAISVECINTDCHFICFSIANIIAGMEPCYDSNWRCPFWSLFSYCLDYEEIKYIECPLSCGACTLREHGNKALAN